MTAKIKLNAASGGGSFSLQAPSSSANNRVMTLPDTADGTILTTTNPKAGNIIQVIQTVKTDVFTLSTQTFTEVTGLNVLITPSSASNKILVEWGVYFGAGSELDSGGLRLQREFSGSSNNDLLFVGDQEGSNANMRRATNWATHMNTSGNRQNTFMGGKFLDSPNTTNQIKYLIKLGAGQGGGATVTINRSEGLSNTDSRATVPSSITAMEVAV